MAVAVPTYTWTPRGDAVMRCPLWEYYLIEARRAVESNRTMGPTSGSSTAAAMMLLQHLACSAAGGALALGVRWAILKKRGRSAGPDRSLPER
jgi:hypothetical protein